MKLSTKIVVSFFLTVAISLIISSAFIDLRAKAIIQDGTRSKALVLVRTFESQIGAGYGQESASGRNEAFSAALQSLTASFPDLLEINIYKIASGKVVASNNEELIGKDVDPEDIKSAQADANVVLFENSGGKSVIDVTSPLHHKGSIDYVMGVKSDIGADTGRITAIILQNAGISAVIFILVVIFALAMARSIVAPITTAAGTFRDIAAGDADLTKRLEAKRQDELGQMAADFNTFVGKLREIVVGIKGAQVQLSGVAADLSAGSARISSSVARIASSVAGAKNKAEGQSEVVLDSASAIEEIAKNIESMNGMVSGQAACVSQASASIEEMVGNIASVFQSMERMAEQFMAVSASVQEGRAARDEAASLVASIAERSRSLEDANQTISDIASKTNLLAMNAAIEAAHAGEAGKGFSVVADEIRTLAEDAANQSRTIEQDIGEVRSTIESVVASTDRLGKAFGRVESNIDETGKLVTEVREAMSEQREGSNQLLGLIQDLNSLTAQVRDGSSEMSRGNETLLQGTTKLRVAAEGMKTDIEGIAGAVKELELSAEGSTRSAQGATLATDVMEKAVGSFKV